MTVVRRLARPLLAATFVASGADQLRNARETADQLRPVLQRAGSMVPQASVMTNKEMIVARTIGAVQVGAGTMLAAGKFPRIAALVLAKMAAINALVEFKNTDAATPEGRRLRRSQLLKNLGLAGAALLAAVDTAGAPSLAWRAGHLAEDARRNLRSLSKSTGRTVDKTAKTVGKSAKTMGKTAQSMQKTASMAAAKTTAAVTGS
ncbi:DoxX family protein [Arthrobacter sp. GCM10027362]|uniref:DoxX family protein n=1 Tax=Arthrobacter sp. GCM10027362 TaxID=3273379 RepID=UPI003630ECC3